MIIVMKRKRITIYYQPRFGHYITLERMIDEEFHSPKCLCAIAQAIKAIEDDFVFLCSEKYGCRQFTP